MERKPQETELPPTNERPAHNRFWFNFFWLMKSSCLDILCCCKDILRLIIIAVRGSPRSWSGQGGSWRVHLNPWGQPLSPVSGVNCFHLRKVSPLKLSISMERFLQRLLPGTAGCQGSRLLGESSCLVFDCAYGALSSKMTVSPLWVRDT